MGRKTFNTKDTTNRFGHFNDLAEQKTRTRYDFGSNELQNLLGQNPDIIYTEILDLSVAQPFTASPQLSIRDMPGRAVVIFGIDNSSSDNGAYNPVTNAGIEKVKSTAVVYAQINSPRMENIYTLKHARGFRGDFQRLFLAWPAQSQTQARLIIYKFDDIPWYNGEAPT